MFKKIGEFELILRRIGPGLLEMSNQIGDEVVSDLPILKVWSFVRRFNLKETKHHCK